MQPSWLTDVEREHALAGFAKVCLDDWPREALKSNCPLVKPNDFVKIIEQVHSVRRHDHPLGQGHDGLHECAGVPVIEACERLVE